MNIRKKNKQNAVPSLFAAMWIDSLIQFRSFFVCTSAENLIVWVRVSIIFRRRFFPRFSSIFRGTILDLCAHIMSHKIISNTPRWISRRTRREWEWMCRDVHRSFIYSNVMVWWPAAICVYRACIWQATQRRIHTYICFACVVHDVNFIEI